MDSTFEQCSRQDEHHIQNLKVLSKLIMVAFNLEQGPKNTISPGFGTLT
jgi:hypothetical protein